MEENIKILFHQLEVQNLEISVWYDEKVLERDSGNVISKCYFQMSWKVWQLLGSVSVSTRFPSLAGSIVPSKKTEDLDHSCKTVPFL